MPKFRFQAHDRYSKIKTGTIEAPSEEEAGQVIRNEYSLFPMKIELVGGPQSSSSAYSVPAMEDPVGKPLVYNPSMRMSDLAQKAELTPADIAQRNQQNQKTAPALAPEERVKMGSRSVVDVGQVQQKKMQDYGEGKKPYPQNDGDKAVILPMYIDKKAEKDDGTIGYGKMEEKKADGFGIGGFDCDSASAKIVTITHRDRLVAALEAVGDTMAIMDSYVAASAAANANKEPGPTSKAWLAHRDKFHMELLKAALVKATGF